jgi:ATP-binding cassette subfamily C (CFTR/MRP) protein 1
MFRGATASVIYTAALSSSSKYNQMTAVTLMSTDIDRLWQGMHNVVEFWARLLEVSIGIWLLWRQLGPVAIAPIIITAVCVAFQTLLSKKTGSRQGKWVQAIQRRVGVTSTVLRSMKSIKLAGLVDSIIDLLHNERVRELDMAKSFRVIITWNNVVGELTFRFGANVLTCVANAPGLLNPLVVFAVYSIQAKLKNTPPLSTAQAFTAIAIVGILTAPLGMLLVTIFNMASATGCYHRVQDFLSDHGLNDQRIFPVATSTGDIPEPDFESDSKEYPKTTPSSKYIISVSGLVLGSTADARATNQPIHFEAERGTLTMIIGPVGSGKTTLLKAILGEWEPEVGSININTPIIGYCSQSPWLQNCSIRDNIIGAGALDVEWYNSVIQICALENDLTQMPSKDQTIVGSRGVVLSGGQKHRIVSPPALWTNHGADLSEGSCSSGLLPLLYFSAR